MTQGAVGIDPTSEAASVADTVDPNPRRDHELTAPELIEALNHCAGLAAATAYRMMTIASLINDERELDYAQHRATLTDGQHRSVSTFADMAGRAAAGEDPCAQFGPNGLEQAIAEVGATLTVTPAEARELIEAGDALRYRLSFTGHTLACGRIDKRRFLIAMKRTELIIDAQQMQTVDVHLAEAIYARAPMSITRFTAMVDSIVARWAPDAVRRRRDQVAARRKVALTPDRFTPGQARISGTLTLTDAAEIDARLASMATAVHPADPRPLDQRRVDALTALARGEQTLTCRCDDCVTVAGDSDDEHTDEHVDSETPIPDAPSVTEIEEGDAADDQDVAPDESKAAPEITTPAGTSTDSASLAPRPTFHIVVNLSTLLGIDDDPAFLDRYGILDAETTRTLLADARRTYINPDAWGATTPSAPPPDTGRAHPAAEKHYAERRYAPSKKLQALTRAGELCCTFPGCNAPVWRIDLDHTTPFDHTAPERGGLTSPQNLKPLCRFHHRIKTFTSWQDYQDDLLTAWFTTPTGHMFVGNAYNGRDLFNHLTPRRPPDHPARKRLDDQRREARRREQRAEERWNRDNPPPF